MNRAEPVATGASHVSSRLVIDSLGDADDELNTAHATSRWTPIMNLRSSTNPEGQTAQLEGLCQFVAIRLTNDSRASFQLSYPIGS
jgi:hypothetical protein